MSLRRVRILTYAKMEFGLIPKEHWNQPDWIDEEKATASREAMQAKNIIYAGQYFPLLWSPLFADLYLY